MSLTPEQLEIRRNRVSASDAAAIVGVNPYRTAHDVWLAKVTEERSEENERMTLGHAVEPVILRLLAQRRNLALTSCTTIVHPTHTWLCATPDAMVTEHDTFDAVAEAKLVGSRLAHHWGEDGDAIPDYVRVQVQVQMTCTITKRAFVGALLGTELRDFVVEHDPDLEAAVLEECEKFHRFYLAPRLPPPPDASEASRRAIEAAFPRHDRSYVPLTPDYVRVARDYLEANDAIKAAEEKKNAAGNLLRAFIGEHEGAAGFGFRATWKATEAGGVDWKALALELGATPEMQKKYQRAGVRRLLVKETNK